MIRRAYTRALLLLGAYQTAEILPYEDDSGQYTESGNAPLVVKLVLRTAMDEPFVYRDVTAILTEQAQRDLIAALEANLNPIDSRARINLMAFIDESASTVDWT